MNTTVSLLPLSVLSPPLTFHLSFPPLLSSFPNFPSFLTLPFSPIPYFPLSFLSFPLSFLSLCSSFPSQFSSFLLSLSLFPSSSFFGLFFF